MGQRRRKGIAKVLGILKISDEKSGGGPDSSLFPSHRSGWDDHGRKHVLHWGREPGFLQLETKGGFLASEKFPVEIPARAAGSHLGIPPPAPPSKSRVV